MTRDITPHTRASTNLDNPEILATRFPLERDVIGLLLDQCIENGNFITFEQAGAILIKLHRIWIGYPIFVELEHLEY